MQSPPLSSTPRTRLRRFPERGRSERAALYKVLDAGLICYFAVNVDGTPRVIPITYGRDGETLYLHGSPANSCLTAAEAGNPVCVNVTHVDGLVLSRSMFNHSMRFRSAVIYGVARRVTDEDEKRRAMHCTAEQLVKGRWETVRQPTRKELAATLVLALPLTEASVKVRDGWPHDFDEDLEFPAWAGALPLVSTWGSPEPDPGLGADVAVPDHLLRLAGQRAFAPRQPQEDHA